ncbi:MAG: hypothetical protein N3A64_05145, partial [Desulfobacterota bacterium]|nr:hypothetical protein [Thermodesulfobacteriota bacterium]
MEITQLNKVVVHFRDHTLMKGTTGDFSPNKPQFHLIDLEGKTTAIPVDQLKAIFFVKDLIGNRLHKDNYDPNIAGLGRKIWVKFYDGEVIIGHTLGYSPEREGFFIIPADPESNNERIFVVKEATK